ncbi:hypothetical protein TWF730_008832 [Orbilia blumenaviensis]|uniref:Uncharacterized protein n=1 Tax=Orbilia blumenaviensis TaxID=1796055 RepID=A0AAV9V3H8_9PEZI
MAKISSTSDGAEGHGHAAERGELCALCQKPLPLWGPSSAENEDADDSNFTRPPALNLEFNITNNNNNDDDGDYNNNTVISGDLSRIPPRPLDITNGYDSDIDEAPIITVHAITPISDLIVHLSSSSCNNSSTRSSSNKETRYLVSSQILRVVSPVWRRQLDPESPFQSLPTVVEASTNRPHTLLTLHDDDPNTLLSVFNILHFSTANIPTSSISFNKLKAFAVLCDKYDCVHVLKPYSRVWLDKWASSSPTSASLNAALGNSSSGGSGSGGGCSILLEPGYEDWLFIAKVFGDDRFVGELEQKLMLQAGEISLCGTYFLRRGGKGVVETALIPEATLKRIMQSRQQELTRQLTLWRTFLQTFITENATKGCPNYDCVTLSYGNLIRSVEQSGLVAVFNLSKQWHGNILEFEEKTAGISLANGTRFHGYGWCPVENLNVALRAALERKK